MNKFIFKIICFTTSVVLLSSCKKLLEKPLGSDITEETIFSTRNNVLTYLAETYRQIVPFGFPYFNSNSVYRMDRTITATTCDEANFTVGYAPASEQNIAGMAPINVRLSIDVYAQNYVGIRYAWKLFENVDRVVDMTQQEKEEIKAECKALIAMRYSNMLKNYGGLSLVKKSLSVADDIKIERSSIEETVNYIVSLCEEASTALPNTYSTSFTGRVTAGVARAIKAETLLFAASPLFNSNQPYLQFAKPELICYGSYDKNRWKKAADAAKEVLDWAAANDCYVINTGNPFVDFGNATSMMNNPEVLMAYQGGTVGQNGFTQWYLPTLGAFNEGNSLTYNILPQFYKNDGTNQVWPTASDAPRPFAEYNTKMDEMEPRFKSTFWKYGASAWNNPNLARFAWNYNANVSDMNVSAVAKLVKFTYNYQGGTNVNFAQDWIVFRLAEFYLNYAEAMNEHEANHEQAYWALNIIRRRAGLPEITLSNPNANTQEKLREIIRRERAIELFAEEHRPYDIRRWKIAHQPGIGGGDFYTFGYTKNTANNAYLTYQVRFCENRYWNDKMFLCPILQTEINKGYATQNPGY